MTFRPEGSSPFFKPSQSLSWSPLDDHQEPDFTAQRGGAAGRVFDTTHPQASPSAQPKIAYYMPPPSEASEWVSSAEEYAQQQKQGVWIFGAKAFFSLGVLVLLYATLESHPAEIFSKIPVSLLPWVPIWATLYLMSQWFSAWRWQRLGCMLGVPEEKLSVFYLFKTYIWGTFFNLCLPGAVGGDLVRVWRLSATLAKSLHPQDATSLAEKVSQPAMAPHKSQHPLMKLWQNAWTKLKTTKHLKSFSAVLVLLDRLLGFAVLAWMMSLCLLCDGASQQLLGHYAWVVHGLSLLSLFGVIITWLGYGAWIRPKLAKWYPEVAFTPSKLDFSKALGLSVIVQGFNLLIHWLLYQGFVAYSTSLTTLFSAYGLAAIASVIPLSLGGLGTREGAYVLVLTQAHWDKPAVLSFAMMWFVVLVVSGLMAGGLALLLDKIPDDALKQWLKKSS